MQGALLSFTGIPLLDQIIMYNGARLEPTRTLGAYGLPVVSPAWRMSPCLSEKERQQG